MSSFYYTYILWDTTTHTHFYVGHTSAPDAPTKTQKTFSLLYQREEP